MENNPNVNQNRMDKLLILRVGWTNVTFSNKNVMLNVQKVQEIANNKYQTNTFMKHLKISKLKNTIFS